MDNMFFFSAVLKVLKSKNVVLRFYDENELNLVYLFIWLKTNDPRRGNHKSSLVLGFIQIAKKYICYGLSMYIYKEITMLKQY